MFGVIRKSQEGIQNRILYTGQQYDRISGQYYLRARYYNPVVGRFLQEDVYRGDGLNLYAFCRNNPVVYYDPSGMIGERTPGYNVYGLYDNDSEKPYYIGITNDLERRAQEHKETGRLDPKKSSLRPLDVDITYGEARGYEQCYIDYFDTRHGIIGEEISSTNRQNKYNSYDRKSKTRDPKRQEYFENAYKNKLSQLEEGSTQNVQCKDMGME